MMLKRCVLAAHLRAGFGGPLPPAPGSPLLLQVSGDFGSGAEGGHQPLGKVGVSWCLWVLCSMGRTPRL